LCTSFLPNIVHIFYQYVASFTTTRNIGIGGTHKGYFFIMCAHFLKRILNKISRHMCGVCVVWETYIQFYKQVNYSDMCEIFLYALCITFCHFYVRRRSVLGGVEITSHFYFFTTVGPPQKTTIKVLSR